MIKILAIDFNKDNLILLTIYLSSTFPNAKVITSHSGKEGIDIVREENPDVILIEVFMPIMNGFETCKIIKEDDFLKRIPIIMIMNSEVETAIRVKGLKPAAEVLLNRPIDEAELTIQINSLIGNKGLGKHVHQEFFQLNEDLYEWSKAMEESKCAALDLLEDLKTEIEHHKLLKEELLQSKEQFRNLFQDSPVGLYRTTPDGKILLANHAIYKMLGFSNFEKQSAKDLQKCGFEPSYRREKFIEQIKKYGKVEDLESKWICYNGEIIIVRENAKVICDSAGKPLYYDGTVEDITERKRAEEVLLKSESVHRKMIANIGDVIVIIDKDGINRYKSSNVEKHFGWKPEELIGASTWENVHPEDKESTQNFFKSLVVEPNLTGTYECRYRCKDGFYKWIGFTGINLLEDPEINGILGNYRDISSRRESESFLRKSEHFLQDIQTSANLGAYSLDVTTGLWTSSGILDKIFGISTDYIRSVEGWISIIHPDWQEIMSNYFIREVLEKRAKFDKEYQIVRQNDKAVRWVHGIGNLKFDKNNQIVSMLGIILDITEQKRNEELLKASETKYHAIFDNVQDVFYQTDLAGTVLEVSPSIENILGFSRDEIIGKPIAKLSFDFKSKDMFFYKLKENGELRDYELRLKTKTGEFKYTSINARLIFDADGKPNHIDGAIRDITQRKLDQVKLQASKEFLKNIINAVASPVFVKDDNHKYVLANNALCSLLKIPIEKIIGSTDSEYFPEEQLKVFIEKDNEVLKTGKENINEEYFTDGTGKVRTMVSQKTLYTDTAGNKFLVGVINDITQRKQTELELIEAKEKAEESDRLKSAFLTNMSHEIRTPMNGILGFAELLKEPNLSTDEQNSFIEIIGKSGQRMLNTINSIIDISKIESGLVKVNIQEANINEKMEFTYKFFKPEVESKGIQFLMKTGLAEKESIINTDNEMVYGILTNLVKNAIKFTHKGSIELGYEKKGKFLEFHVKDTGIGIPKDRLDAIFDRFIKADIEEKQAFQGSGLGLTISKSYVEMLGGKMWIESEEGLGSIFYFTIPYNAIEEENTEVLNAVPADDNEVKIKNLKILIAEDEEISGMLLEMMVNTFAKKIIKAITGLEAVDACRLNPDIDLILMDIQMPQMNGYEATRQIREFNKEVVIIAQTAYGLSGDREKAIEAGCNDYITKPINKTY
jgi:PAS domain S-box-containing protein